MNHFVIVFFVSIICTLSLVHGQIGSRQTPECRAAVVETCGPDSPAGCSSDPIVRRCWGACIRMNRDSLLAAGCVPPRRFSGMPTGQPVEAPSSETRVSNEEQDTPAAAKENTGE